MNLAIRELKVSHPKFIKKVDITPNELRFRILEPKFKIYFPKTIKKDSKGKKLIYLLLGKNSENESGKIQSIRFSRENYSVPEAIGWIERNISIRENPKLKDARPIDERKIHLIDPKDKYLTACGIFIKGNITASKLIGNVSCQPCLRTTFFKCGNCNKKSLEKLSETEYICRTKGCGARYDHKPNA